jgi:hypothetical protein
MPMLNFRYVQPDHIIDLKRVGALLHPRDAGRHGSRPLTRQRDLNSRAGGEKVPADAPGGRNRPSPDPQPQHHEARCAISIRRPRLSPAP